MVSSVKDKKVKEDGGVDFSIQMRGSRACKDSLMKQLDEVGIVCGNYLIQPEVELMAFSLIFR